MSTQRAGHEGASVVVDRVTHGQHASGRPILAEVSLTAAPGHLVVVEGRSGSGKSTLCQLIAGLEAPDSGTVSVLGEPAEGVSEWSRVAYLPQRLGLSVELTVAENVFLPCWMAGLPERPDLLHDLDIARFADRLAGQVSRGEQQRVAIARAAVLRPPVIVLDEPTSHQDEFHLDLVMAELVRLAAEGSTVVVATHDPDLVAAADEVVHLDAGSRRHR